MFHSKLRQAIARLYPDRFTVFTWKRLLADFVDQTLKAFTLQWMRYRQKITTQPPDMPTELQEAVTLLAKQQKLSYEFLALSHFTQLHQVGALTLENEQLRELHQTGLANLLMSLTPELPREKQWEKLVRTMILQLISIDAPEQDNATLLDNYIEQAEKAHAQQLDAYCEAHTDEQEFNPPDRPQKLLQAIVFQALLKGQTYESMAYQLFTMQQESKADKWQIDLLQKMFTRYKGDLETLLPIAEDLSQIVDNYNQSVKLSKRQN